MMRLLSCPLSAEVLGVNISAFINNLQSEETKPIMRKYGVIDPSPHEWYNANTLLKALNEMVEQPNVISNFVAIGMEIGNICPMPPEMTNPTLGEVLSIWNDLYQSLHRGADVGAIACEKIADTHYRTIHTDIYPDDFSYGIAYGFAKRFLPVHTSFKVTYDDNITPRDYGGTETTIMHVKW